MIQLRQTRGERRFSELDSGQAFTAQIFGSVVGSIAGGVASAGASSLLGGLFGDEDEISEAYQPMIEQLLQVGDTALQYSEEAREWADEMWGQLDEQTQEIVSRLDPIAVAQAALAQGIEGVPEWIAEQATSMGETGTALTGYGEEAIARHETLFQPLEEQWISDYESFTSGERLATEAGRAAVDVTQAYDAAYDNALRELQSYGIDPGDPRYANFALEAELAKAADIAGAQTEAARYVEEQGRGMRQDILNYGMQYPQIGTGYTETGLQGLSSGATAGQQSAQAGKQVGDIYGQASQTYQDALGALTSSINTGSNLQTLPNQYLQTASNAYGGGASATQQQQSAVQQEQGVYDQLGEDIGGPVGVAVGTALGAPKPVTKAGGGHVTGPGGPKDDAIPARLSNNEYVIPAEVVMRKGTEFFDRLVDKTRSDMRALPA